jgi:hypothetical protein
MNVRACAGLRAPLAAAWGASVSLGTLHVYLWVCGVQVHHLISLGGWNDVIAIYLSIWVHCMCTGPVSYSIHVLACHRIWSAWCSSKGCRSTLSDMTKVTISGCAAACASASTGAWAAFQYFSAGVHRIFQSPDWKRVHVSIGFSAQNFGAAGAPVRGTAALHVGT